MQVNPIVVIGCIYIGTSMCVTYMDRYTYTG